MTEPGHVAQAVVLRIYPNLEQAGQMRQWLGACRALWNHLLALQKATYEADRRFLSKKELEAERQRWEQEPACEWRQAAQSQTRQRVVIEFDRTLRDFFKSRKGQRKGAALGFPRFKRKMSGGAFYVANTRLAVDADTGKAKLGKVGAMSVRGGRMPSGRILGARVRYAAGRWFLAVQFEELPPRVYGKPSRPALGIDVGLKAAVARSDGVVTPVPKFFRKAEKRLKRLSRRMSASVDLSIKTKTRLSRRGMRKAQVISRLQMRIADKRRDFQHHRSSRAVGKAAVIGIETLNVKAMAKGPKSVADTGMAEIHRQIEYKAAWAGRQVVRMGRYDRSTGVCPEPDCGTRHDRDIAAACVIEAHAVAVVGRVPAEPGHVDPTDVETGGQVGATALLPVPVVEASSVQARSRRRGADIYAHTVESKAGRPSSLSSGPLFERSKHGSG